MSEDEIPYTTPPTEDATTPPPPSPPPEMRPADGQEPLVVGDPVLMETLASLDRDVSGETKFCLQAAEALRSFQYRWSSDIAVENGYADAIRALDNMRSILAGAQVRWGEELTRKVGARRAADQYHATATTAREHALEWAEHPPPAPPQEATAVPPEAGVLA